MLSHLAHNATQYLQTCSVLAATGVAATVAEEEPYSTVFLMAISAGVCLFTGVVSTLRLNRFDLFEMTKVGLHTASLGAALTGINNQFIPQEAGAQLALVCGCSILSLGGMLMFDTVYRKFAGKFDGPDKMP